MEVIIDTIRTQFPFQTSVPDSFIAGFTHNFIFLAVVFLLSTVISPLFWGTLDKEKHILWHSTVIAAANPYYVGYCAFPEIVAILKWIFAHPSGKSAISILLMGSSSSDSSSDPRKLNWLLYPPTDGIFYATGLTVGFMTLDSILMVVWFKPLLKVQKALYWQYAAHHILSMLLWPTSLCMGTNAIFIIYWVFTEVSSIFLNIRWLIENRPGAPQGTFYMFISGLFLLVFFIIRVLPVPLFLIGSLMPWKWYDFTIGQVIMSFLTCPIPFMLNLFWFSLMMKKAIRIIKGIPDKPKGEKKKDK